MRNFIRKDSSLSLCGLNCRLCPMLLGGHCPGCGGGAGNQSCAIAKCSLQRGNIEYCFLCPDFPCQRYEGAEEYDSFITHQRQLKDIKRAQEIGIEAYINEQTRKAEVLQILLSDYNDGRKKKFYCLAVNLIPLQDLEMVMIQAITNTRLQTLTIKEKMTMIDILRSQNLGLQMGQMAGLWPMPGHVTAL